MEEKKMTREEMKLRIRTLMDEVSPSNFSAMDIVGYDDDKPVDAQIEQLLDASAIEVLLQRPLCELPTTKPIQCAFCHDLSLLDGYHG